MTNCNIFYHAICRILAAAVLPMLAISSCTVDEMSEPNDDSPVIVTAYASESQLTRVTYNDYGPITSGTYYLCYPANVTGTTKIAEVEFGDDGYGEAIVMPDQGKLTWKAIGNGTSNRTLSLTNVSPDKHYKYDKDSPYNNPIIFKSDEEQFAAGRYIPYGEENTNDILLGNKSPYRTGTAQDYTSNYVHFELHHCMARVRVIIETHPVAGSFDRIKLDNAKVDITKVVCKPYSFDPYPGDRTDLSNVVTIYPTGGTLDNCTFGDINLLNTLDGGTDSEWAETGDLDQDEYPDGEYFTTYDILLPPQMLRDNDRPRLVITLPDDTKPTGFKTYSGVLPHIMFDEDENPFQFEFLAEHLLTIRTVISNDSPELIFMPAKVVEWVDKGSFNLNARQAGIYTEDDFLKMIECYNGENPKKLLQFGTEKEGKWVFDIFSNLSLSNSDIMEKMKVEDGKQDYSFNFNIWYTVTVDDTQVTESRLKSILSGIPDEIPDETPDEESTEDADNE